MWRIVRADPKDYREIVTLSNLCFPEDRGAVELRWCHVWGGHLSRPSSEYLDNFFLAKESSRIVGMVAVCPMTLQWAGEAIQVGGISAVATHPDHRGRGIMTELLGRADRVMAGRGDVISVLGGDRSRYGRFGWEHVGSSPELFFSGKYLERLPDVGDAAAARPRLVDHRDAPTLARILALHERGDPRFARTPEQIAVLAQRRGVQFWCLDAEGTAGPRAAGGRELAGYIGSRDSAVKEWGGDTRAVLALFRWFARMKGAEELKVSVPARFDEQTEAVFREAEAYRMGRVCSLKILRFRELMQKLSPALSRQPPPSRGCGERLRLEVEESGQAVTLACEASAVHVIPEEAGGRSGEPERLRLPRRDMARLLFGPFVEGLIPEGHPGRPVLLSLFPLPLSCSEIDLV